MANPLESLVPGAGIEPARGQASRDFKSLASTYSATQAIRVMGASPNSYQYHFSGVCLVNPLSPFSQGGPGGILHAGKKSVVLLRAIYNEQEFVVKEYKTGGQLMAPNHD